MPSTITRTTDPLLDRLLAAYERDGVMPLISGGDHDDDTNDTTANDQTSNDDTAIDAGDSTLGDAGKEAIRREREARKAAEKARRDAEDRATKLEAEAKKRADKEAQEQGKWQELAETRDAELRDATTKAEALQAERDALAAYVKADIATVTKAVKDAKDSPAAKALLDFYPGDDAEPTALLAWAGKAKTRLGEITKDTTRGNGPNPKPRGQDRTDIRSPLAKNQYM